MEEYDKGRFVTVIVPLFGARQYIDKLLSRLMPSLGVNLEVLFIDDCSADGAVNIVERVAETNPFVRVIKNSSNRGVGYCRNVGINNALGEYVYFLDSDDAVNSEQFAQLLVRLGEHRGVDVLKTAYTLVWDNSDVSVAQRGSVFPEMPGRQALRHLMRANTFDAMACVYVVRTEFLRSQKIAFIPEITLEDNLYAFQLLWSARSVVAIDLRPYEYLQRHDSISKSRSLYHLKSLIRIYQHLLALGSDHEDEAQCLRDWKDFQLWSNFRETLRIINRDDRRAFWKWLGSEKSLGDTFRGMVQSALSRQIIRYNVKLGFKAYRAVLHVRRMLASEPRKG
jgi:glycosyltransferase involved in cell wall biosynthesis